ncbi:hypothetical protein Ddc_09553 [Ditylenchus destructor]|nr:hypothetical protein Ddc_09553 [Ditylenchus destructor]
MSSRAVKKQRYDRLSKQLSLGTLVDIFQYLNRNDLETFSIVNRQFNQILQQHFLERPFRLLCNETLVLKRICKEIKVRLEKSNADYLDPITRQWHPRPFINYFTLEQMHPFLNETVRVRNVMFLLPKDPDCTAGEIESLSSLSRLWVGQEFSILNDICTPDIVSSWIHPILSTPSLLKCSHLQLDFVNEVTPVHNYPSIYTLNFLGTQWHEFNAVSMIDLIEHKGLYPRSNTTFVLWDVHPDKLTDDLRNIFVETKKPLHFTVHFLLFDKEEVHPFQLMNQNTKEILQLREMSVEEVAVHTDYIDHKLYWTLERLPIKHE